MKDYYGGRWKIFIDDAINAVEQKKALDEKEMLNEVNEFSWNWSESQNSYSSKPKGNTRKISEKLYQKYRNQVLND